MIKDSVKIFAASLIGSKKFKAVGVFSQEKGLIIASISPVTGAFGTWRQPLVDEVQKWVDNGAIVLVEENGEAISQHGTKYLLEDMDDDSGKTNLAVALDAYFQLQDSDYLIIPPDYQRYVLQAGGEGSWIEKKSDDKGRPFYNIDWQRFTGAHRAILLCVVAAMYEPISGRFLEAMWGKQEIDDYEEHPVKRWKRIFKAMGHGREAYLMEERGEL